MDTWSREEWETAIRDSETALYYLYTPICGTCAVASKMIEIVNVMKPDLPMGKADLNYAQDMALDYKIESVPCLLIARDGIVEEKVYAFESVPNLLEKIS